MHHQDVLQSEICVGMQWAIFLRLARLCLFLTCIGRLGPNACRFCYDFGLFSVIDLQSLQPLPESGSMEKSLAGLVWGCTGTMRSIRIGSPASTAAESLSSSALTK